MPRSSATGFFTEFMSFEKLEKMLYSFHKRCQQVIRIIIVSHTSSNSKVKINRRFK
jgi:hypothetical protein